MRRQLNWPVYIQAEGRYKIISLSGSFHGRTLATVAATGQPKFHKGFEPLPEGFLHAPFGDLPALEQMIDSSTCAILCEPLQGEGGVRPLAKEYLQGIKALCDKHGLLLIFDEIQTGMGRTGTLFAYEQLGIQPDILTMAKALGNGLPIGGMLTRPKSPHHLFPEPMPQLLAAIRWPRRRCGHSADHAGGWFSGGGKKKGRLFSG